MEAIRFLNILKKHKYILLALPILVMGITFMLTRKLPNIYSSKGNLAAGLVENSQTSLLDKSLLQESKVNQQFANLIQMIQLKQVYNQVSYQLILHDLTDSAPFRKPSKLLESLNESARKHAVEVYYDHYLKQQPLSTYDRDQKGLVEVLKSMGYDFNSLQKKLKVYRIENSDFITVECEADSPMLSSFAVNTLCKEFVLFYANLTKENQYRAVQFLDTILRQKRDTLMNQMDSLKEFKIQNHILNSSEYSKTLYSQRADLESRIQEVRKEIDANTGALDKLNKKFTNNGRLYSDTVQMVIAQKIVYLKNRIYTLDSEFVHSGFDPAYKSKIDSLKQILTKSINRQTDDVPQNPNIAKGSLINQKMDLEVKLDLALGSIKLLENEYKKIDKKLDALVPHEAAIQKKEGNISVASQEYIELQKKYDQTSMSYYSGIQLRQVEFAMPGEPLPSKKMILVALSGIGCVAVCILILFILFYLDNSIQFIEELANRTNVPVLGLLPLVKNSSLLHLNQLWQYDNGSEDNRTFKNQLRSIRFETDEMLNGSKVLAITSLSSYEGKTFLSLSLASAYIMVNKKVLIIDGNFNDPALTRETGANDYLEDYLADKMVAPRPSYENDVTVLGNRGMDTSLFELSSEKNIVEKIEDLKYNFDIIIIEASALNTLNQAKEWISVSEKVLAVFEANKTISRPEKGFLAYLKSQNDKFIGWIFNKAASAEELVGGGKANSKN